MGGKGRVKREGRGLRLVKGGNSGRVKDGKKGEGCGGKRRWVIGGRVNSWKKGKIMDGEKGEGYGWENGRR